MGEWTKEQHDRMRAHVENTMLCGGSLDVEDIGAMLAEIERGWAEIERLTAPVDVEREVEREARRLYTSVSDKHPWPALAEHEKDEYRALVRPLVEDRARLAREVERLTGECDAWHRAANNRAAYAEKIGLPYPPIAELDAARAEIESLTRGVSHHMTVAAIHRAEIARLTAELAERTTERDRLNRWWCDVRKMFGEDTKKINRYAAALEATDGSMSCDEEREAGQYLRMLCYALAAVDEPSRSRTAAPGEAWERLRRAAVTACEEVPEWRAVTDLRAALAAVEPTVDITAITHDYRPGAQDGMPRLADVEAREVAPIDAEDLWTDYRTERPHLTASDRLAFLEGVAAARRTASPPRALTETPRAAVAGAFEALVTWLRAGEYIGDEDDPIWVHIREVRHAIGARALTEDEAQRIAEAAVSAADTPDDPVATIRKALLRLSRGDVPPEVRPVPAADPLVRSDAGSDMTKREFIAHEAREMAVTTAVPSIAGPAGLDAARKAGGGR